MKGLVIIRYLIIFLLFATPAVFAQSQLLTQVAVERLMANSFTMRSLLHADVPPAVATKTATTLRLSRDAGQVHFYPARPTITAGEQLQVQVRGVSAAEIEVYPRDQGIVTWQADNKSLTAVAAGTTEIIFIVAKTLHILPLQVRAAARPLATLVQQELALPPPVLVAPPPASSAGHFKLERAQVAYRNIEIQVIDERSSATAHYPVSGMQVRLLGSRLRLQTDARGVVSIAAVPAAARLLLQLHDPRGRYVAALQEVYVHDKRRRYQVTVQRDLSFSTMQRIIGRSQDARLASFCAVLTGTQGEYGFRVTSDAAADGAYYFNQLQLLAPQQTATARNNRFCLFNIDPGPLTLFITDAEGQRRAVFTVGLAAGYHVEETFALAEHQPYRSWLAVAADLHRPLHGQQGQGDAIVDFVQMRMVGDDRYLTKVANGLLETPQAPDWHYGRSYVVTSAAEFEDALYQLTDRARVGLVPLLVRGFIENTALLAEQVHDATLGSVVIEHGARPGEDAEAVALRLITADGRELPAVWSTQAHNVTRSVFLNLDYGVYQVVAENDDGHWLAAGTVVVYNETTSFLRTGTAVVYEKTP